MKCGIFRGSYLFSPGRFGTALEGRTDAQLSENEEGQLKLTCVCTFQPSFHVDTIHGKVTAKCAEIGWTPNFIRHSIGFIMPEDDPTIELVVDTDECINVRYFMEGMLHLAMILEAVDRELDHLPSVYD